MASRGLHRFRAGSWRPALTLGVGCGNEIKEDGRQKGHHEVRYDMFKEVKIEAKCQRKDKDAT